MYAWVTQWKIKPGHTSAEALAVLDEEFALVAGTITSSCTTRAYTAQTDQGELLIFDEVWSSIEAYDQWWEAYRKTPEYDAFFARWHQVAERFKETTRWQVTEWRF